MPLAASLDALHCINIYVTLAIFLLQRTLKKLQIRYSKWNSGHDMFSSLLSQTSYNVEICLCGMAPSRENTRAA